MEFSASDQAYLAQNHAAIMTTLRADGSPHAVRIGVALVDGTLWTSGVPGRVRTRHLRHDPRATITVFDNKYGYLSVEGTVTILDGPDAAAQNVRLFDLMQAGRADPEVLVWNGKPLSRDAFEQAMRDEQRLIYALHPTRTSGMHQ